eukprot:TRINITY_DN193_c0_g3_i1.p1 TRINITY_DN193_c0_g3~~TRINITY_DN193_c0_g3_i1.p1  ORF type:complete len:546 (-),score=79.20 TRINITY_DN193_c0_g3_i1:57-1694(-)
MSFVTLAPLLTFAFVVDAQRQEGFLGVRPVHIIEKRGPADLLAELESEEHAAEFDHVQMTAARTERLEVALLPLFNIAPKDASGHVDADAARYLLHRLFANRHGWFVNGLELHEGFVNTSNVGKALYDSGNSFSIRQLARFAASLETLVHAENIKRLQKVFTKYSFSRERPYNADEARKVLKTYMILFLTIAMPEPMYTYEDKRRFCEDTLPEWSDTMHFADEVGRKIVEAREETGSVSLWEHSLSVVEEVGERYGRWQNKGCLALKSQLVQMETSGTGRVPLSSFWKGMAEGRPQWPFRESAAHLEQLGALDGIAPHQSVVIPNYVYSAANCLAGSRYYDVCCLNECESILGEIESHVNAPTVPPTRLAELVANLPSSTVDAPRTLPTTLLARLDGIAARHGGVVPLHGRLFWQFLSHAYPRECPYPRLSMTKAVETTTWIKRFDDDAEVSVHLAREYVYAERAAIFDDANSSSELPWTDEEELFMRSISVEMANVDGTPIKASMLVSIVGLLLVACAVAFRLFPGFATFLRLGCKGQSTGYYV